MESRFSGSSRIGMDVEFQAHSVLESIPDFRLISGLENARSPLSELPRFHEALQIARIHFRKTRRHVEQLAGEHPLFEPVHHLE